MHVALVGDSHLAGDRGSSASTKLAPRLRGDGITVTNLAFAGARAPEVLARIHTVPVCDWAIYSLGTNDAAPWKAVDVQEFIDAYSALLQLPGPRRRVILGPATVRDRGDGRTESRMATYRAAARAVAGQTGSEFVDLSMILTADGLGPDGVHLNDNAYALLAAEIRLMLNGR